GQNLQQLKQYDQAMSYYEKADTAPGADPTTRAHARLFAGFTTNRAGDPERAIKFLASVTEVEDANKAIQQQALRTAGKIRQDQQRYAEAREWYLKALELGAEGTIAAFVKNGVIECDTALSAQPEFFIAPYVSLVSAT